MLAPVFELRAVTVAPGCERAYDPAEWRDALVLVARGAIELESVQGSRCRLRRGAMLWLAGLRLRALCNRGHEPALLIAVSPRAMSFRPLRGYTVDPRPPGETPRDYSSRI